MLFIDNKHKDLYEVRCKVEGTLLGFVPASFMRYSSKPIFTISIPRPVDFKSYYPEAAPKPSLTITFEYRSVFIGPETFVRFLITSRDEWIMLIDALEEAK